MFLRTGKNEYERNFDYYLEELKIGEHDQVNVSAVKEKYGSRKAREAIMEGLNFIIDERTKRIESLRKMAEEKKKDASEETRKLIENYERNIRRCNIDREEADRYKKLIEDGKDINYKGVPLPANHTEPEKK